MRIIPKLFSNWEVQLRHKKDHSDNKSWKITLEKNWELKGSKVKCMWRGREGKGRGREKSLSWGSGDSE